MLALDNLHTFWISRQSWAASQMTVREMVQETSILSRFAGIASFSVPLFFGLRRNIGVNRYFASIQHDLSLN